ncbi:hypothetical protein HK098_000218, partial [Nowakowskiella sp. JEL0407]
SALDILNLLIRIKLPNISPAIYLQYIDYILDCAYNTPTTIVKTGALELLETILLIFPLGITPKLSEARDVVRSLLVDQDLQVRKTAGRIYPMIFRVVSVSNVEDFFAGLRMEVDTLKKGGLEVVGDPLVSKLSKEEQESVFCQTIEAMGAISQKSYAYTIVHELLHLVKSNNGDIRLAAASAILSQVSLLDPIQAQTILWILLPLYGDPNIKVRLAYIRYLKQNSNGMDLSNKAIPPHPDDVSILPVVNWEDVLLDNATITCNSKNLADILYSVEELISSNAFDELPPEDDGFYLPTISAKLMARFKQLVKLTTGELPADNTSQVIYFMQEFQKNLQKQGNVILVLSEFCCIHESTLNEIIDILVTHLGCEITSENTPLIEACMLGLRNIS